jgi:hypothetical protein
VLRLAAAVAVVTAFGSAPARSQGDDGPCRISGGWAALLHDVALPDGSMAYRGVIILRTRACGDGPKGVTGAFAPIAGSPASCSPIETPRLDESRCAFEGSLGVGVAGTPVVVTATAHTSGVVNDHVHDDDTAEQLLASRVQPGAEVATSECVLLLPEDGGRYGCTLF